ncbi:hypothetical protein BN159_6635 [Streptomyces davaonensis JCM 4913]|uniref:LigA protein n=1 Tax=Streptomyces davaonensis (strain DSM 101723 / JCM 4913 / KCC S-0913 / 768) TaxID=1214101 RepID=K4RDI6_STRDJ|nr:hypothetical protein [Streptomyces davaonensis]CCK31014.1 hypothetical protein BN159_6635 [Streptomyces davaonensis JCM 4913]
MTQSLLSRPGGTLAPSRPRALLRAVAIVSCLPYLGLKVAWLSGSEVGIPKGSSLLEHRGEVAVANGVTLLMDACVIVLAFVLTRPWGMRVPAWLLAVPVWVATGLLAPIMTGFPLQLLTGTGTDDSSSEPFLHDWVFSVVYGGFIVQGLALGTLFALYARDRWGHLWQGRMWELPRSCVGPSQRVGAVAAAVVAVVPLTLQLRSAFGGEILRAMDALYLLAAVGGALVLAFGRAPALPVRVPLALVWVGSGAAACWGAWMSLASLVVDEHSTGQHLTHAGQMITGILVAAVGVHFLARRSAVLPRRRA